VAELIREELAPTTVLPGDPISSPSMTIGCRSAPGGFAGSSRQRAIISSGGRSLAVVGRMSGQFATACSAKARRPSDLRVTGQERHPEILYRHNRYR